jgi:hypothetical protein
MDTTGKATLAAIEAVIWQLVINGALPAAQLAAELERYARFSADAAPVLQTLAHVARAGGYPQLVSGPPDPPQCRRRSRHHG